MQWLNIFYCFINYHFGFIYFLKIANWRQKGKYKNNSAIFLSPKMLQPIILETTLNFIFGLQLSSKWSPNGLLFTSKVVSIWSPMETFSSLPISSQPCNWSSIYYWSYERMKLKNRVWKFWNLAHILWIFQTGFF